MTATRMGRPGAARNLSRARRRLGRGRRTSSGRRRACPDGLHLLGPAGRARSSAASLSPGRALRVVLLLAACSARPSRRSSSSRSTPWRGARFTRESAAGPIGTGMMLAMLGFALVWLVPSRSRCSRSGGSAATTSRDESYGAVIFGGWLALGRRVPAASALAVLIAMGLAKWLPRCWWIPAARVLRRPAVLLPVS